MDVNPNIPQVSEHRIPLNNSSNIVFTQSTDDMDIFRLKQRVLTIL